MGCTAVSEAAVDPKTMIAIHCLSSLAAMLYFTFLAGISVSLACFI